jgi:two-component system, sensor histidine kinase and response regulator
VTAATVSLTGATLDRVLPFHAMWDGDGLLTSVSPALRRYWGLGDAAPDTLELVLRRPFRARMDPRQFCELTHMSLDTCAGDSTNLLHAELIELETGAWLMVGMPAVENVSDLERSNIALGDLPTHLGLGYLLLATESVRIANAASAESARQREAAEAAGRAKGQFLANMSHELRTPLNAVMGFVHLCLKTPVNAVQERYLRNAHEASRLLLGLINEVLDFSKIEAHAVTLESVRFELGDLVSQAESMFGHVAREKGLEFRIALSGRLLPLLGDPHRIGQVLTNLIGNAIKFTEQGSVTLAITATALADDDVRVEFQVQDTGIGIAADQFGSIMSAFHQADASTTRRFGGTGLGLAISEGLVTLMGGTLAVDSRVGAGSVFHFALSLRPAQRVELPAAPARVVHADTRLRDAAVLVVDDNELNRLVISEILRAAGAHVHEACDGRVALDLLASNPVQLVLMDLQMPVMDGFEATRRLRADPLYSALPVVALTADALVEDHRRALDTGVNEVLTKPVSAERLTDVALHWLNATQPA